MSESNAKQNTIFIPPDLYYEDRAHTSLATELNILSRTSDQMVVEKVRSLQKQLKNGSSEISDIVWNRSKEIAESKVRLSLSELLAKTNIKTAIVDEIGSSGSQSSSKLTEKTQKFRYESNEDMNKKNREDRCKPQDEDEQEKGAISSDTLQMSVTESMIGKVERTALIVDFVNLEEVFEDHSKDCENIFDLCHSDIMDLRPASRFTEKIPVAIWEKFVSNTYPEYEIPEAWEKLVQDIFKPKDSLAEWIKTWRGLYAISDENESNGDLGENQYNAQFVSPVLNNVLKAVLSIDWRILEVPVESSKHRRNSNINPIIDKVLEAKRADGLARLWQSHKEVLIYEQTGPPDFDDVTQFYIHDYKLVRAMRDVLNQRITLRLKDGISDHKDLASFGAFGHRTE
ncbi:770_t:CDS:10, partial [Entrophospora sp. SA101]